MNVLSSKTAAFLWCAAFSSLLFQAAYAASASEPGRGHASVRADRLSVSHEQRTAVFEGKVEAKYRSLRIRCDRLDLSYGEDGAVRSLEAKGRVRVFRGGLEARAKRARLDTRRLRLLLEGEPQVKQGPQKLEGRRIQIDLRSGEIEVVEAKGVFRLQGLEDDR